MPIFRVNQKNVYFAHIPKCGGSTVEEALRASGFSLSYFDGFFWERGENTWYKTSPQHIPNSYKEILFDENFFDYEFSIVRDPIDRFLSAFNHNRKKIGRAVTFNTFLRRIERRVSSHGDYWGFEYDNHFLPASRFVSDKTRIFFLSDGIESALSIVGEELNAEIAHIARKNVKSYDKITHSKKPLGRAFKKLVYRESPKISDLSNEQIHRLKDLYREDYQRFSFSGDF